MTSIYEIETCSPSLIGSKARKVICRPSNIMAVLGMQEWFANDTEGSKHRPIGVLSASVTRNALVAICELISIYFHVKNAR